MTSHGNNRDNVGYNVVAASADQVNKRMTGGAIGEGLKRRRRKVVDVDKPCLP